MWDFHVIIIIIIIIIIIKLIIIADTGQFSRARAKLSLTFLITKGPLSRSASSSATRTFTCPSSVSFKGN